MKLKLINSIDPANEVTRSSAGGVGLENVMKRLEILYQDKYNLVAQKLEEVYVVNLDLELELLEEQYKDRLQLYKTV